MKTKYCVLLLIGMSSCSWLDEKIKGEPEVLVRNISTSPISGIDSKACNTIVTHDNDWDSRFFSFGGGISPGDSTSFSLKEGCYDFRATLTNRFFSPGSFTFPRRDEDKNLENGTIYTYSVKFPSHKVDNQVATRISEIHAIDCEESFDSDAVLYDVIGTNIGGYSEKNIDIGEGCADVRAVIADTFFVWEDIEAGVNSQGYFGKELIIDYVDR